MGDWGSLSTGGRISSFILTIRLVRRNAFAHRENGNLVEYASNKAFSKYNLSEFATQNDYYTHSERNEESCLAKLGFLCRCTPSK